MTDLFYGYNTNITNQISLLHNILKENKILYEVIYNLNEKNEKLNHNNYYIGAGCICQTVWNYQNNLDLMKGIDDIDFVYFDASDLSYDAEDRMMKQLNEVIPINSQIHIDVKNEARVHLWYEERFGTKITPYTSVEDAINTWPSTASAIGVRLVDNKLLVYAPFGLNDMFGQIIRANKRQITREIYEAKCQKWKNKWNTLTIIEW